MGYYRKFVQGYGKIAILLTDLLRKEKFLWSDDVTQVFRQLQLATMKVSALALPDFTKAFTIENDAYGFGVGAVLMQENNPMAYFSQVLGNQATLKLLYERELIVIVLAMQSGGYTCYVNNSQ